MSIHATAQTPLPALDRAPPRIRWPVPTVVPLAHAASPSRNYATIGRFLLLMPKTCWMALDALIVIAGLYIGYWLFRWFNWENWDQIHLWQAAAVLCPTVLLAGLLHGLHEPQTLANRSWIIARTLLATALSLLVSYAIVHFFLYDIWSRRVAVTALACYATFGVALRLLAARAIRDVRPGLLFIGETPDSPYMRTLLQDPHMRVYGALHHLHRDDAESALADGPARIDQICRDHDIREIVVDSAAFENDQILNVALESLRSGRRVTDAVTFFEKTLHRVPVDVISPEWLLFADLQLYRQEQATLKRLCDLVVSALGLAISVLISPLVALAIKLDSAGPVFYSQDRVGLNGKVFRLYKFRTMAIDAESSRALWSQKGDQRVTRVGRFLRRSRLDELPQLWNIFLGQMSVVGPRPERPQFIHQLAGAIPFYNHRHLVKPGLTGWAQINYRYGNCIEDARRKLEYDLYYIKHKSLELDFTILVRTLHAVLTSGS